MSSTLASASASGPAAAGAGRKPLFKRPAWAASTIPSESRDFFRHADTVYVKILEEKERKKEQRAQRKLAKRNGVDAQGERDLKRRRLSPQDEDKQEIEGETSSDAESEASDVGNVMEPKTKETDVTFPKPAVTQPAPAGPSKDKTPLKHAPKPDSNVIEIDSDQGHVDHQHSEASHMAQKVATDDEASETDDEYVLELKRKARERGRQMKLAKDAVKMQSSTLAASRTQPQPFSSSQNVPANAKLQPMLSPPDKKREPIVQILITTNIPDAKPLLVNRKVSQSLRRVREVWCARQNFDDEMAAKVLLTWRGKRLYDTSTSTHLLQVLKNEEARRIGRSFNRFNDDEDDDERDPSEGRIEVEAMTKEMFEQKQHEERTRSTQTESMLEAYFRDLERPPTPKQPVYKVLMNAKGLEPLQLKVRSNTSISKVMEAFRKMRGLDPQTTCWLVFDGDRLEPDTKIGDTEIEDGDALEVHVR